MAFIHRVVLIVQEVYVRGEVGIQLDFDFQLTLALGDDNFLYEHSKARIAYRTVFDYFIAQIALFTFPF